MKLHANARTCPHCRSLIVRRVIDDSQPPTTVATEFRVTSRTVHKWVTRYRKEGEDGLVDKSSRPHRIPRKLLQPGKELHDAVMSLLHTPPADSGFNRATWKMSDLRAVLAAKGAVATQNNIRAVIKNAGYRWKQARVTLTSVDPNYREKLAAIRATLSNLADDEAFFSIDEFGPFAVKTRAGRSLQAANTVQTVPKWQKSRGSITFSAALELSRNQIIYAFSEKKNTAETIHLIELFRKCYAGYRRLFLSWDAAPWHASKTLIERIQFLNQWAKHDAAPQIEIMPLPSGAQFLNVIESVFSGMARAIIHNSDYRTVEDAQTAIVRYIDERNSAFRENPRRAGRSIWGKERTASEFLDTNNCKDVRYR
jgi:transposase